MCWQGRELERVYVENGVIDKLENVSDNECFTNEAEIIDYAEGVIGHMEDTDGSQVVDLVFDSLKTSKKRKLMTIYSTLSLQFFFCSLLRRTFYPTQEIHLWNL